MTAAGAKYHDTPRPESSRGGAKSLRNSLKDAPRGLSFPRGLRARCERGRRANDCACMAGQPLSPSLRRFALLREAVSTRRPHLVHMRERSTSWGFNTESASSEPGLWDCCDIPEGRPLSLEPTTLQQRPTSADGSHCVGTISRPGVDEPMWCPCAAQTSGHFPRRSQALALIDGARPLNLVGDQPVLLVEKQDPEIFSPLEGHRRSAVIDHLATLANDRERTRKALAERRGFKARCPWR